MALNAPRSAESWAYLGAIQVLEDSAILRETGATIWYNRGDLSDRDMPPPDVMPLVWIRTGDSGGGGWLNVEELKSTFSIHFRLFTAGQAEEDILDLAGVVRLALFPTNLADRRLVDTIIRGKPNPLLPGPPPVKIHGRTWVQTASESVRQTDSGTNDAAYARRCEAAMRVQITAP